MKWLNRIFKKGNTKKDNFCLEIKCSKCGNEFKMYIDPSTDLIKGYSDNEPAYKLHKETLDNKCLNSINIEIKYDNSCRPIEKNISGAEFI